ncbi:MAG TPA: hypothetical protein PKE55_01095 [Kiritimatiellia bacterium]|nr:hypothetical protein [Kiritimatiellia bacterium]
MKGKKFWVLAGWVVVIALSLWIRVEGARLSYPAQGDASHFVQHGVSWAVTGKPVSGYWSLGPQYLAGWAYSRGWDPSLTLQWTTVGFGVLVVMGTMALGHCLSLSAGMMLAAGLVVAVNPALLKSATGGLSETPLMACLLLGYAGLEWSQRKKSWMAAGAGGLFFALAMYYRPFEAMVGLGAYGLYTMILGVTKSRPVHLGPLVLAGVVFVGGALPFWKISAELNTLSASQSKLVNLAYRDDGLNSKAMRSLYGPEQEQSALAAEIQRLEEQGAVGYLWANRGVILRKIPVNILQAVRWINQLTFGGAFAMGLMVFLLFTGWMIHAVITRGNPVKLLLPALYGGLIVAALSLSFVHPRWMFQLLPFYALILGTGAQAWAGSGWWRRVGVAGVVLLFSFKTGVLALEQRNDRWVERNVIEVGQWLRDQLAEGDRIMGFGPELAVQAQPDRPWDYIEMPFGEVHDVDAYAGKRGVTWVVLSTRNHAHYPVHEVYRNPEVKPVRWTLVRETTLTQATRWGQETETFYIYRLDAGTEE